MKKILISIAFLGSIAGNITGQNNADSVNINKETEIMTPAQEETASNNNVLSDFLAYIVKKSQKKEGFRSEWRSEWQSEWQSAKQSAWHYEPYFGFGFIAGGMEDNPAKLLHGSSYSIDFGIKSRYQVTPVYSLTFNTGWLHNRYKIVDGIDNNILGNSFILENRCDCPIEIENERFRTWALNLSFGNRFNLGKRSNFDHIGKYIEISVYGNYAYSRKYLFSMHHRNKKIEDPVLFNPFEAGAQVNLGIEHISIWGRYRLTDWFDSDISKAKLPPFVIGAAVNF
jgi:hypothetical protein